MTALPAGERASAVRREVGPVAWCALECLAERSVDGRVTEASVRGIAAELGVAKNTAHRAVAALTRIGLVEADQRRDGRGRFQTGRYLLHLEALTAEQRPASRARRLVTRFDDAQLSLLPGA